ncbi:hypothetical protein LOCC1_G002598 [Lachnellula occidentalis]|uniref:Ubiquitin-like-conjugating enzyme ATG10 n=1 Tax=Lachnellula occidentalis TaxID=215460 RepID=A0A8H8S1W6_9HELO|nr:hypothetical protein LOCC1_G002598 [Lachnellula occidentalis]
MVQGGDYRQWPFLTPEEFELVCAFFDQKYVRAKLGPTRKIFKIRLRRTLTTGSCYIEILRLLQLPEETDDLSLAFGKLNSGHDGLGVDIDMLTAAEDADQVSGCFFQMSEKALRPQLQNQHGGAIDDGALPQYSLHSHQPYATYEVHLHPTYNMPTLWFTLHDLPMSEPTFDLESVYRYLVPPEYKSRLRAAGFTGGISAAPHPVTDVPAFFIHPCQTKEAMESFDCKMANYLMIWLGLVGGCVGLWVPPEMAAEEAEEA